MWLNIALYRDEYNGVGGRTGMKVESLRMVQYIDGEVKGCLFHNHQNGIFSKDKRTVDFNSVHHLSRFIQCSESQGAWRRSQET